jgi:beta-lactamase regulating signal transducer with metallopeptidase domain
MNSIGITFAWCVAQVTLIAVAAGVLYLAVRRRRPAVGATVVSAGLLVVAALSLVLWSPWPRWTPDLPPKPEPAAVVPTPPIDAIAQSPPPSAMIERDLPSIDNMSKTEVAAAPAIEPPKPEPQPATLAVWWRAIVDDVAGSYETTPIDRRHWPAVLAVVVLLAAAGGMIRLLVGVLAVRRQRTASRPLSDAALLELIDVLRAELGCIRPIEVRQSADLTTAATVGWRRPTLLLPADWSEWTPQQRRAILAHEIAHARNADFLSLTLGQIGVTLHFYHPLVHWLLRRLRLEQELAADAAAAQVSGGQRRYLTALAELALHDHHERLSRAACMFLPTQTTFLRRIAMLRGKKELRDDRPSPFARWATIGAVLVLGVLAAGLREPDRRSRAAADETPPGVAGAPSGITPTPSAENVPERKKAAVSAAIVEGVGWKDVRIGATRDEIIKALGKPDDDSSSDWLKWKSKHIECTFHGGDTAAEIRFNPGFQAALTNGLKPGSPASNVLKLYGEPTHVVDRGNGAKEYEYMAKGILFWTYEGKISQIVVFAPPGSAPRGETNGKAAASAPIVEGIGWKGVKIGATREQLAKILGKADKDSSRDWIKWRAKHIECTFHGGDRVAEVRFNPGFQGALANGLRLGSPGSDVFKLYGEPTHVIDRGNGAKEYEYSEKGILFWTYEGKITQIVVFRPAQKRS